MASSATYIIRVGGQLDPQWSDWFGGMRLTNQPGAGATLEGPVADQAALHGLLALLRDLNLEIIELRRT